MKYLLTAILAAMLLASVPGCRDDRDDETGRDDKQDRLDTTRGRRPGP